MREVRVNGERFADAEFLHDDEAQTVHCAERLILVSLEIVEGRALFIGRLMIFNTDTSVRLRVAQ
jgi:hypothetical protein